MKKRIFGAAVAPVLAAALALLAPAGCVDPVSPEVAASVTGVSVQPGSVSLVEGGTQPLTVTVSPDNAGNKAVTWTSSNPAVAVVSNGVVIAAGPGTATIVVTTKDGGKHAACAVTVTRADAAVTGVILNTNAVSLAVGATASLVASVTPADAANQAVTWSSNNPGVAMVDQHGAVTAVAPGTAVVIVTTEDGEKTAICVVTVSQSVPSNVSVTGVSLSPGSAGLVVGETQPLAATVSPGNATNQAVNWTSSNPAVALVSDGVVIAAGPGTATIMVTTADSGKFATCAVTVTQPVSGVSLNTNTVNLAIGATSSLVAAVAPANATNQAVSWSSSNPGVARVDQNGAVTALAAGTVTITVTTADSGRTATCAVTVTQPAPGGADVIAVTGVSLDRSALSLTVGQASPLAAAISPSNAANQAVTWISTDGNVASVAQNGMVTGRAPGSAVIMATTTDGGYTADCAVTVLTVAPTGVSLNTNSMTLLMGVTETATLTATVNPTGATNRNVTWTSSNMGVVTVNGGAVTAVGLGTATITATTAEGGMTAMCAVTVSLPTAAAFTSFTSVYTLSTWLASQPVNTAAAAYRVALTGVALSSLGATMNGYYAPLGALFNALNGKYVCIDLSGCTGTAIPFNGSGSDSSAGQNKDKLVGVILPAGLTSIGKGAFYGCTNLTQVSLPAGLTSIGDRAFGSCTNLVRVTFEGGGISSANFGSSAFPAASTSNDNLKTAYRNGGAGTYTRQPRGSEWSRSTSSTPAVPPDTTFVYYWVNEQNQMTLSAPLASIPRTQNVTVAAQGFGYTGQRWFINGVEDAARAGQSTYVFRGAEHAPGRYTVGLRVSGGGAYYYAEFTVTVTN
ncbi:MAG: Ig-like domain-containing protein [Treponema sp.]|jgi:uncharacterized protein YjdB|nr:Ig-like domain-containing protein [Treponema sp.]